MILRKREISLQHLGTQVLGNCPTDASQVFTDGYLSFVRIFFQELDCGSEPFLRSDNAYEVDLPETLELTIERLERIAKKLENTQKREFWCGSMMATEQSHFVLKLAFESPTSSSAA